VIATANGHVIRRIDSVARVKDSLDHIDAQLARLGDANSRVAAKLSAKA
jgi:hypothetical protein